MSFDKVIGLAELIGMRGDAFKMLAQGGAQLLGAPGAQAAQKPATQPAPAAAQPVAAPEGMQMGAPGAQMGAPAMPMGGG